MFGALIQRSRLPLAACLLLALFALAGCGGRSRLATVEGQVTIDGQPASSGMVHFRSEDGKSTVVAEINRDGVYHASDVPNGAKHVTVFPRGQRVTKGGIDKGANSDSPTMIPKRYQDPDSSGLSLIVKSGTNTYNIEMSSK